MFNFFIFIFKDFYKVFKMSRIFNFLAKPGNRFIDFLLQWFYYYLFIIVSWFDRFYKNLFIFKSVYILDKNLHKQNKTLEFYISYFTNFKIKNKSYYKIHITNQNNISKIFTSTDFKKMYEEYKTLKASVVSKRFISFKINNVEYKEKVKEYCFYNNSILDFYVFNVNESIKDNIELFKKELDDMVIEYKIFDISKHNISKEYKITYDINLPINSLE